MYVSVSSASRENILKTIRFETPDYIPMTFHINASCAEYYDMDSMGELIDNHKFLFPNPAETIRQLSEYGVNARAGVPYKDSFGCVWQTTMNGIVGTVKEHPLADWAAYKDFSFPDPEKCDGLSDIDWSEYERNCESLRAINETLYGDLRHGHTFMQLCDLRGYENLLGDMVEEEPLLNDLINRLNDFNLEVIKHFIKAKVDIIRIPEDLGMQQGPMLSRSLFIDYILPSYSKLVKEAHESGILVHMHSDGNIRMLADLIASDIVDALNLQDLVNGIDWIAENYAGKKCIDLDIDRQSITPFGTPEKIDALVREEVSKIGRKEGGLMMIYGLYPGVPLENVKALMDAMERYAFYFSK